MFCPQCGHANPDSSRFCVQCGRALAGDGAPAVEAQEAYSGFWIRVGAYLIDYVIIFVGAVLLNVAVAIAMGESRSAAWFLALSWLVLPWLYTALLESGARQATVGKLAVSIKVTGMDGRRIGFGRATGRYFAEILSSLTLGVGYAMVAFTKRRQSLHDLIAGTLVVPKALAPEQLASAPAAKSMPGWAIVLIVLACMVPMLGIMAAIAIPAYQDYTIRSQVFEGLVLAGDVKAGVAEFAAQTGRWPADLDEAGIRAETAAAVGDSRHVAGLEVMDGTIHIQYGGAANARIQGQVLSLRPFVDDDGNVIWQCGNSGDPADGVAALQLENGSFVASGENFTSIDDRSLPPVCRSNAAAAPAGPRA